MEDLYHELKSTNPEFNPTDVTKLVWRLVEEGTIDVEYVPPTTESLRQYLGIWYENLWLYVSLGVTLTTLLVVYTLPKDSPIVALRWIFGVAFVLFIPGFAAVEAVFPARDLDTVMRLALSIGVSLVLVMLLGLLTNYTPWGITATPLLISLSTLTIGLTLVALRRKYTLSLSTKHNYA
ncbi:MAG TPA: DUF1616 domain-containing protein [Candidatus Bathyarchaeia archaeon]|nr:DUF1616 domain-containing protein [Candidatus Bathyarchaeia archaeon]